MTAFSSPRTAKDWRRSCRTPAWSGSRERGRSRWKISPIAWRMQSLASYAKPRRRPSRASPNDWERPTLTEGAAALFVPAASSAFRRWLSTATLVAARLGELAMLVGDDDHGHLERARGQ